MYITGPPQGTMPSGKMTICYEPSTTCQGFGPGTIQITYSIKSGLQKSYHANPGVYHESTERTAYLPHNSDGQALLKRLKFAFMHGLTFTVGTSQTSNKPNQVTWSSIYHKTSLSGGQSAYGFPDPDFFWICNSVLDGIGVPAAGEL